MVIDHICFAVRDLNESLTYWQQTFGYRQMTQPVINTRQKVKVVFMCKDNSLMVKLIEPMPGNRSVTNLVEQGGGGFHHICFRCKDLPSQVEELMAKNVKMLAPPQPGEAFNNHDIAFFLAKNRITFEVIDTQEKAALLDADV
jgi:methylmalonyl-CoA/ethylmalonyl-CoA epimerase